MIAKTWPKLYKQTATKKIQEWEIWVEDEGSAFIVVKWGQKDGEKQQTVTEIEEGKNLGKANATTYLQQAISEAESIWKKKQDKGYRLEIADTAEAIKFLPMLAKNYKKDGKKIIFPCLVQPKLNGFRCLAVYDGKAYKLLSRGGKIFEVLDHIQEALLKLSKDPNLVLDGELYKHGMHFQDICKAIKRDSPTANSSSMELHIYDCFSIDDPTWTYTERLLTLQDLFELYKGPTLKLVKTEVLDKLEEIEPKLAEAESQKYEGIMLRNTSGIYEANRRSKDLQKVKSFEEDEFEIIGANEGKGKFQGLAVFVCKTQDGKEFDVTPVGTEEQRKWYWDNYQTLIGKMATVKYQALSKEGKPIFANLLKIKDEME